MSTSDTRDAKKYASIAEVAAAQCKQYTEDARNSPQYAEEAKDSAEAADLSAQQSSASAGLAFQYESSASLSAANALASANAAASSAATAGSAATAAVQVVYEDLASSDAGKGGSLIDSTQPFTGSIHETQHIQNAKKIDALSSGAKGDGTNDDAAFAILESQSTYSDIDLLGKTYGVTTPPATHRYFNGYFKRLSDDYIFDSSPDSQVNSGNRNILIGTDAGKAMPKYVEYRVSGMPYNVISLGYQSLTNNTNGRNLTAIGTGALKNMQNGRYCIAIGLDSQYSCNSSDGAVTLGTRNTTVGDNSMRFNVSGYSNIAMGRNAGQCLVDVSFNSAVGSASLSGYAPLDLDDTTIVNQTPITAGSQTMIGVNSGVYSNSEGNTCVGYGAGSEIKKGTLTALGFQAAGSLEINSSYDGFQRTIGLNLTGTYSWVGGVITVTINTHGISSGWRVKISLGSHESQYMTVASVINANTFTITTSLTGNESNTAVVSEYITTTVYASSTGVIAIGRRAMLNANSCSNSIAIGETSQFQTQGINNTSVGGLSLSANTTGTRNSALGYSSLRANTTGTDNTSIGEFSLANATTGSQNTALGRSSLRTNIDTTLMTSFSNCTGVGFGSQVSASNQVALGDPSTTVYVYGTVQNRSDIRDKADWRDTDYSLAFVRGLRAREYRWDMREDYVTADEEGNVTRYEKDGSKKRERFHSGYIAQEVKELCDKLGVDFGGYQDHSITGGCDVLSLGYDEFIPHIQKATALAWDKIDELEARISKLESK